MVALERKLSRRISLDSSWCKSGQIVLVIDPRGYIGFREPRKRALYTMSIKEALRQAVVITSLKIGNRVKELRKQGYGLGEARRKARKELL